MKVRYIFKNRILPFFLLIILIIPMGCFFVSCGSNQYSRDQNKVSIRQINRFFSKVRPSNSYIKSQYQYAIHLQKIGKHKISIEVLNDIVKYDPGNPRIFNALGISYDALAKFEKANQSYQQALQLNPNLDYVHNNLGYSQLLQEEYEGAKKSFRQAISLADKNSDVSKYENNLALVNAKSGVLGEEFAKNEKIDGNSRVKQPQAHLNTIEKTVQFQEKELDQSPKVHMAGSPDSPALHWDDDKLASADLSDLEKNSAPQFSENSNKDFTKVKTTSEKVADSGKVPPIRHEKIDVTDAEVKQPRTDLSTIKGMLQVSKDENDPSHEIILSVSDSKDLYWENNSVSEDFSDKNKDRIQRHSKDSYSKVTKAESEKIVGPIQVNSLRKDKWTEINNNSVQDQELLSNIEKSIQAQKKRIDQGPKSLMAVSDRMTINGFLILILICQVYLFSCFFLNP